MSYYEGNLKKAVLVSVSAMDFEDRDNFVRSHAYNCNNSNSFVLSTHGLKRDKVIARYYPHYTIDNLYEFCVVRNLIRILNQYGNLLKSDGVTPTKRAFTLGHWVPLSKGGAHHRSNWVIQTFEDNQQAGEDIPTGERWSLKDQLCYIISKINFTFVDKKYLPVMERYLCLFSKVY